MKYDLPVKYDELTPAQRREVRFQYTKMQKNLCYFCKCSLDGPPPKEITDKPIDWRFFPPNFTKYRIHLQHSHISGLTEGAVHSECNAYFWQYHGR